MTTDKITRDAIKWLQMKGYKIVTKNVYFYDWECDVFGINTSNIPVEIEVKVSKMDFMADFDKIEKHRLTSNGEGAGEFWFAVPRELASKIENYIPSYAGLLSYTSHGKLIIKKPASRLHNDHIRSSQDWEKIALKLYTKLM